MAASLKTEQKLFIDWARRVVQQAESDEEAARRLLSIIQPDDETRDLSSFTRKQLNGWLDTTAKGLRGDRRDLWSAERRIPAEVGMRC